MLKRAPLLTHTFIATAMVGAALAYKPINSQAVSLGELQLKSHLGEPLDIIIPVKTVTQEHINKKCFSVLNRDKKENVLDSDLNTVSSAAVFLQYKNNSLHLKGKQNFNEPFGYLTINIDCGGVQATTLKDYSFLVDKMPAEMEKNMGKNMAKNMATGTTTEKTTVHANKNKLQASIPDAGRVIPSLRMPIDTQPRKNESSVSISRFDVRPAAQTNKKLINPNIERNKQSSEQGSEQSSEQSNDQSSEPPRPENKEFINSRTKNSTQVASLRPSTFDLKINTEQLSLKITNQLNIQPSKNMTEERRVAIRGVNLIFSREAKAQLIQEISTNIVSINSKIDEMTKKIDPNYHKVEEGAPTVQGSLNSSSPHSGQTNIPIEALTQGNLNTNIALIEAVPSNNQAEPLHNAKPTALGEVKIDNQLEIKSNDNEKILTVAPPQPPFDSTSTRKNNELVITGKEIIKKEETNAPKEFSGSGIINSKKNSFLAKDNEKFEISAMPLWSSYDAKTKIMVGLASLFVILALFFSYVVKRSNKNKKMLTPQENTWSKSKAIIFKRKNDEPSKTEDIFSRPPSNPSFLEDEEQTTPSQSEANSFSEKTVSKMTVTQNDFSFETDAAHTIIETALAYANACYESGEYEQAISFLRSALDALPEDIELWSKLFEICQKEGMEQRYLIAAKQFKLHFKNHPMLEEINKQCIIYKNNTSS